MTRYGTEHGLARGLIVLLTLAIVALISLQVVGYLKRDAAPPVLGSVPTFTLLDQAGAHFSSKSLDGKLWLATFIYTTCPGPCPRVVERMKAVDEQLGHDPRVRLVSFSVDPTTDTPEVLATYARDRKIDTSRWSLLTGRTEEIYTLARLGFKLGVDEAAATDAAASGPVVHSIHAVLIDGQGRIRGYYDTSSPEAVSALVNDARRLLRDPAA
jgi:protein SCO1/2